MAKAVAFGLGVVMLWTCMGCGSTASQGGGEAGAAGSSGAAGASGQAGGADLGGTPGVPGPSCDGLESQCHGESCCANTVIPAGSFMMGRSESPGASDYYEGGTPDEVPAHSVTVSTFVLDKYEVTVGRFRSFVAAYTEGWRPTAGEGANPKIADSGWSPAWDASLPANGAELRAGLACDPQMDQTWTEVSAGNEGYPINCVTWYEAFAFCIWDEGRLPTEAEWEYAAAGGSEERLYPWGSTPPSAEVDLTNSSYSEQSALVPVGSHPRGAGRWGQLDLEGSVREWNLDWFSTSWYRDARSSGADVCNLIEAESLRACRGGSWYSRNDSALCSASRYADAPDQPSKFDGLRCARSF